MDDSHQIFMDQHIIAENCWKAYDKEKADRLLLLGDILYHGPRNDLPKDYNPKEVIALLNQHKQDILCVRGNCDTEVRPDGAGVPGSGGLLCNRR